MTERLRQGRRCALGTFQVIKETEDIPGDRNFLFFRLVLYIGYDILG